MNKIIATSVSTALGLSALIGSDLSPDPTRPVYLDGSADVTYTGSAPSPDSSSCCNGDGTWNKLGDLKYEWDDGSTESSFSLDTSEVGDESVSVTVSQDYECSVGDEATTASKTVNETYKIYRITSISGEDICSGDSVEITVETSPSDADPHDDDIEWDTLPSSQGEIDGAGTYSSFASFSGTVNISCTAGGESFDTSLTVMNDDDYEEVESAEFTDSEPADEPWSGQIVGIWFTPSLASGTVKYSHSEDENPYSPTACHGTITTNDTYSIGMSGAATFMGVDFVKVNYQSSVAYQNTFGEDDRKTRVTVIKPIRDAEFWVDTVDGSSVAPFIERSFSYIRDGAEADIEMQCCGNS